MEINKIYNEDCLNTMANMPDNFIDLTVTSPPYDNLRTYKSGMVWNENIWKSIIRELYRVTKKGGVVVWIVGDATIKGSETGTSFKQALFAKECGFRLHDTMIYHKMTPFPPNVRYWHEFEYMFIFSKDKPKTFNPIKQEKKISSIKRQKGNFFSHARNKDGILSGIDENAHKRMKKASENRYRIKSNIWMYEVGGGKVGDKIAHKHPAIFPEKLANDHIISWSNENDLIYDPFMGSGTTAKMAILNNRNYIGSEISKEYCDVIKERLKLSHNKGD